MFSNKNFLFALVIFTFIGVTHAQFEEFEDAPTRSGSVKLGSGTLEGVALEVKDGDNKEEKLFNFVFLLTKLTSVFFDHYDPDKKAIVLDLYDTRLGESPIDSIVEFPIKGIKVEQTEVDLNKDVEGMRPDLRDVVRIHLYTDYGFTYEVEEEFGVINLRFKWSKKIQKQIASAGKKSRWITPLALLGTAGVGAGIYYLFFYEPTKDEVDRIKDAVGDQPPGMESIPVAP